MEKQGKDFPQIHIINLATCDSTNNWLKDNHIRLKEKLPVLVQADNQTAAGGGINGFGNPMPAWVYIVPLVSILILKKISHYYPWLQA